MKVWNYWSALRYLFKVGGSVNKEVYLSGENAITVTYIRFDEPQEFGHYTAFDKDGYLLATGKCISKIETELGLVVVLNKDGGL